MREQLKDILLPTEIVKFADVDTQLNSESSNPISNSAVSLALKQINITDYYKKAETSSAVEINNAISNVVSNANKNYIPKKGGNAGEVIYRTGSASDSISQRIVDNSFLVCENQQDLDICKCKKHDITFEDIYDNWQQFGNYNGLQYPKDSAQYILNANNNKFGVSRWIWSNEKDRILQDVCAIDFCGFVSENKFYNYDAIVNLKHYTDSSVQTEQDTDGCIGFIAAAAQDVTGKIHTISFVRTPNADGKSDVGTENYHWYCILDCSDCLNPTKNDYSQVCLAHGNLNNNNEASGYWTAVKHTGTNIRVIKEANKFKATTTVFQNKYETISPKLENEITVDINQLIEYYLDQNPQIADTLMLFKNQPVSVGFCTQSVKNATFDILQFNTLVRDEFIDYPIVNLVDKKVEKFNKTAFTYDTVSTDIETVFKNGTLSFNQLTNKLFYSFGINAVNILRSNYIYDSYDLRTFGGLVNAMYKLLISVGVDKSNIQI